VLRLAVVRLAATVVFFVIGALVGALVGARLFRLLEGGDGNLLLAVVLIPAIAIASGWLAEKSRDTFVAWGTEIGGAAFVLAGLGVLVSGLAWLRDATQGWQAVVGAAAWVALSVFFRLAQKAVGSRGSPAAGCRPGRSTGWSQVRQGACAKLVSKVY
jgi:asparagine N-glycosylation enzyme membrane subunit Stt3